MAKKDESDFTFKLLNLFWPWLYIRVDHYVTKIFINLRKAKLNEVHWSPHNRFLVRHPCRFRQFCPRRARTGTAIGYVGSSAGTWGDVGPTNGFGNPYVPIFTKKISNS